jgi:hypothetical protein
MYKFYFENIFSFNGFFRYFIISQHTKKYPFTSHFSYNIQNGTSLGIHHAKCYEPSKCTKEEKVMWLLMITFIVFMDANTLIKVTFSHLGNYPKKFISILFQMAWKIIIKDVTY